MHRMTTQATMYRVANPATGMVEEEFAFIRDVNSSPLSRPRLPPSGSGLPGRSLSA
jgi:hypothetical protein